MKFREIKYDYARQCWVGSFEGRWVVLACGHEAPLAGCYACQHKTEVVECDPLPIAW